MRIANALFVGSIAAVLAAPVLAKNSDAQKMDDKSASPSCHASVPAANGPETELPCEEIGAETQSPHKPSARNAEAGH